MFPAKFSVDVFFFFVVVVVVLLILNVLSCKLKEKAVNCMTVFLIVARKTVSVPIVFCLKKKIR